MPYTPYITTARQLFDTLIPDFLQSAKLDVPGPVQFDIEGSDGGAWVVDFGKRTVVAGKAATPVKAIVRAQERDFMALMEGRMSADDGVLTKRLHLAGDAVALGQLVGAFEQLRVAAQGRA